MCPSMVTGRKGRGKSKRQKAKGLCPLPSLGSTRREGLFARECRTGSGRNPHVLVDRSGDARINRTGAAYRGADEDLVGDGPIQETARASTCVVYHPPAGAALPDLQLRAARALPGEPPEVPSFVAKIGRAHV